MNNEQTKKKSIETNKIKDTNNVQGAHKVAVLQLDMDWQTVMISDIENFLHLALQLKGECNFHISGRKRSRCFLHNRAIHTHREREKREKKGEGERPRHHEKMENGNSVCNAIFRDLSLNLALSFFVGLAVMSSRVEDDDGSSSEEEEKKIPQDRISWKEDGNDAKKEAKRSSKLEGEKSVEKETETNETKKEIKIFKKVSKSENRRKKTKKEKEKEKEKDPASSPTPKKKSDRKKREDPSASPRPTAPLSPPSSSRHQRIHSEEFEIEDFEVQNFFNPPKSPTMDAKRISPLTGSSSLPLVSFSPASISSPSSSSSSSSASSISSASASTSASFSASSSFASSSSLASVKGGKASRSTPALIKEEEAVENVFSLGFLDFFENGIFSDISLMTSDGKEYRAHRLLLAFSSKYFHEILLKLPMGTPTLKLDFGDPNDVFPQVLGYMYSGTAVINADNSIPLLAFADKLDMSDLKTRTGQYIAATIRRENCISMLKRAFEFDAKEVIDKCTTVIARNFCFLHADFSFLPPAMYLKILQHEDLAVKNELDLFLGLDAYIRAHPDLPPAQIAEMVRCIRFVHFTMEQMNQYAIGNPIVPPDLVIEALAAKVSRLENPQVPSAGHPLIPRLRERKRYGLTFEYSDKNGVGPFGNGVISWIATSCGTAEYQNPILKGEVKITVSSIDKGDPNQLLGAEALEFWFAFILYFLFFLFPLQ